MNSQQELLDAINTINGNRDKSFDTPATVLRVDGNTVWVHIDGGADETPVQKTINCEQGDTVQVRISDGSAFLVGNASAPPTDDKTANEARFVAVEADEKATKAIQSVEEISQTVEGKVDKGTSGIVVLSSTMLQNVNGVNIYNNDLAVGDSYAHIDEDEFCIREVTSAGIIDDTNDPVLASFGKTETNLYCGDQFLTLSTSNITLGDTSDILGTPTGWEITKDEIKHIGSVYAGNRIKLNSNSGLIRIEHGNVAMAPDFTQITIGGAYFGKEGVVGANSNTKQTWIDGCKITCLDSTINYPGDETIIEGGDITMTGDVYDRDSGKKKYVAEPSSDGTSGQVLTTDGNGGRSWTSVGGGGGPTVLTSSTISSSTTTYTFTDNAILADSVIDVYDTIFGFAPTGMTVSAGSCTITFPAQSSSHTIKLFIY